MMPRHHYSEEMHVFETSLAVAVIIFWNLFAVYYLLPHAWRISWRRAVHRQEGVVVTEVNGVGTARRVLLFLTVAACDGWIFYGREFVTTHPGIVLVFVGVLGEVICDWSKTKQHDWEWLNKASQIVLVLGLTFEFGEAVRADREVADAKKETKGLEWKIERMRNRSAIFMDGESNFKMALRGQPTSELRIWYNPEDGEAFRFAMHIATAAESEGWRLPPVPVPIAEPIPAGRVATVFKNAPKEVLASLPLMDRAFGTSGGVFVLAKKKPSSDAPIDAAGALTTAIARAGFQVGWGEDNSLPDDYVRVVIGSMKE